MDDYDNSTDYDDYDYDFDLALSTYLWDELVPTFIVYILTIILGVTGNLLIIITITRYRRMKSITNLFLASLASADLLLILICTPVKLAKLFSFSWTMGIFLCKLIHYVQNVSTICSVWTLTAISVERYYAIVHPMKAKYVCTVRQARVIIITTWIASFLLAIPILFVQIHLFVGHRVKAYWCVRDWDNPLIWRIHELYMLVIVLIIPASVMVVTYTAICREICRVVRRRFHMTSAKSDMSCESFPLSNKNSWKIKSKKIKNSDGSLKQMCSYKSERQVIKMLVAVVIIFIICWAPVLIENVLTSWGFLHPLKGGRLKMMTTLFHLLSYFNSCVNPLVYGFMSKNFRESFTKALCCFKTSLPKRQLSVSHTRTTSLRTYIN